MSEMGFLGGDPVVVPGEFVVFLSPEASGPMDVSVPSGPSRGLPFGTTAVGDTELDSVLSDLGVQEVRRVHTPLPPSPVGVFASDVDGALLGTFRVRVDPAAGVCRR